MYAEQQPYRELYEDLLDYEGGAVYDDLLLPWLRRADGERRWLDAVRARPGRPVPKMASDELCRLYALSRVVDLLQLSFAPPVPDPAWRVARVGADEHARFMEALGLERVERPGFHPFWHEVVTVDPLPDDDAPPRVAEVYWPGYALGPLLFTRAGCRVEAGPRHLRKEVAERSTLFWAYARNARRTADPSRGWGSNSQWRTPFRRDYALDGAFRYNVDAVDVRGGGGTGLDPAREAELLRHRCFVTSDAPDDDLWPYGLTLVENA